MAAHKTFLKDCDCSSSGIILNDSIAVCRWCRTPYIAKSMPNIPKMKVHYINYSGRGYFGATYQIEVSPRHIEACKFEEIVNAIEKILNNE